MYTPVRELPQNEHRELSQNESICVIWLVTSKKRYCSPTSQTPIVALVPLITAFITTTITELPQWSKKNPGLGPQNLEC